MKILEGIINIKTMFTAKFGKGALSVGTIGSALNTLIGVGNLVWMLILSLVIVIDWTSGIRASKKDGSYASAYGIDGVYRTVVMLLLPLLGNLLDDAFGTRVAINDAEFGVFFMFITGGLIYHTLMSAAANFERAGWGRWVPSKVLESIASEIQAKTQRSNDRKETIYSEGENTYSKGK
jgi:phage-related holin